MFGRKKRAARKRQARIDELRTKIEDAAHYYSVFGGATIAIAELCALLRRDDTILLLDTLITDGKPKFENEVMW